MKTIEESSIYDVLPENFKSDEKIKTICQGVDPECGRVGNAAERPYLVGSEQIEASDSEWLDHLAFTFNDHIWSESWSLAQKKAWIVDSLKKKRRMGTGQNMRDIFESRGYNIDVKDCMNDPNIEPANFDLILNDQDITADLLEELDHIVSESKPVSRHYRIHQKRNGNIRLKYGMQGASLGWHDIVGNISGLAPAGEPTWHLISGTKMTVRKTVSKYYGCHQFEADGSTRVDYQLDLSKGLYVEIDGVSYFGSSFTGSLKSILTHENGFNGVSSSISSAEYPNNWIAGSVYLVNNRGKKVQEFYLPDAVWEQHNADQITIEVWINAEAEFRR